MNKFLNISLLSFVLISCKPIKEIIGVANIAKDGITIRTHEGICIDENIKAWKDSFNNKMVVVKCKVIDSSAVTKKDLGYDTQIYKQGRMGKMVKIKIINIKLSQ